MRMAIFGLARSGISALNFLAGKTEHECFAVNQGAPETWESYEKVTGIIPRENCFDENDAHEVFASADMIIKSPGIPYSHPALKQARQKRVEIVSEIEFAYRHSDIPVVAVTGTNGKTTTATMAADLLAKLGKKVFLGGNIGLPYSEILCAQEDFDWAVVEVSSFQLENIKTFRPAIAVLTNISPSHGERYDSHELYRDAKLKIFQNMDMQDLAILPEAFAHLNLPCEKEKIRPLENFDFSQSKVMAKHNQENLYCAYLCAQRILKDNSKVDKAVQKYIDEFQGVAYRLQFIKSKNGLKIYNDGKSTNMAATLAAIESFQDQELHLALGGKLRSEDMDFSKIKEKKIKKIYAFGEARDFIAKHFSSDFDLQTFSNLEELFEEVKANRPKGVFLFSPAFPSFDLYKNYEERARAFNQLVLNF
ncbi:MAG: UDP-N-acetylmuramoyl-L-alanine--D-glutamate ligase [Bacteriovoracaceae bacterium]